MTENVRIDIWYGKRQTFGRSGLPQRYVNILGRVVGSVRHLHYSLNGAEKRDLSIGPDQRRLVAIGDFNIDLNIANLRHGENTVEITATGDRGDTVTETVVVDFDRRAGRIPCSIDWSQAKTIQEAAQVVDGLWSITNSSISPAEIGYDRLIALGDMNWRDYEVTVPITIHGINGSCYQFPSVHAGVGIILRWKGHWNWGCDQWASGQPYFGPSPYGAIGWYCFFRESGSELNFFDSDFARPARNPRHLRLNVPYIFKARVQTITEQGSQYALKVWEEGTPETEYWDLEILDTQAGLETGAVVLGAHHVAASFGPVHIDPIQR